MEQSVIKKSMGAYSRELLSESYDDIWKGVLKDVLNESKSNGKKTKSSSKNTGTRVRVVKV